MHHPATNRLLFYARLRLINILTTNTIPVLKKKNFLFVIPVQTGIQRTIFQYSHIGEIHRLLCQ